MKNRKTTPKQLELKLWRLAAGFGISDAASETGISEADLTAWENDKQALKEAPISQIMRLCEAYGMSIDAVLTD